jgi:hypothetical protein
MSTIAELLLPEDICLGNAPGRETFIVSSAVANQAVALAHFASRAV